MHWSRRRTSLCAALACAVALGGPSAAGASELSATLQEKVDASVLADAASGRTEFLVDLKRRADLTGAAAMGTKQLKGRFVHDELRRTARESQGPVIDALEHHGEVKQAFWITNAVYGAGGLEAIEAVAALPAVERVYAVGAAELELPDPPGGTTATPSARSDAVVAGLDKVRADEAWALGHRGQGAVVAGADTGVKWDHEALKSRYRGWDGSSAVHDYNWHDAIKNPNAFCPGSSPEPCDDDALLGGGHGTHTVGTMVGGSPGKAVGMAPDAEWIACRNMNNGLGAVPTYLECMQWFLAPTDSAGNDPDPDKAPDVINNSWGCVEVCAGPLLRDQVIASRAAGIFYAVSAGNDGDQCNTVAFPLSIYPQVFSVGATNVGGALDDVIADFSSRGPVVTNPMDGVAYRKPDISAPGVDVASALAYPDDPDDPYGELSGTSMAGPHVAGLVALLISANPELRGDVEALEAIIERTAVPRTTTQGCGGDSPVQVPNNVYGHGRIDALAAVKAATPPIARDDEAATEEETPVRVAVLANDEDPDGGSLTIARVDQPAHGTAVAGDDGTVTYSPAAGFAGSDAFEYTVEDANGVSASATVRIDVDAGDIPGACGEVDDTNSAFRYRHGWDLRQASGATHGAYHRRGGGPGTIGAVPTAALAFTGDRVALAYGKSATGGVSDVYVDGVPRGTLTYASGASGAEQPTFGHVARWTGLGAGPHTLEVRHRTGVAYLDGAGFSCPR